MLTSRDYTLDDLRKLVVETPHIHNPNHSYMFWGHIWIKSGRDPLSDSDLIHKGIHMVQEDEINFVTMLIFLLYAMMTGISVYSFFLGLLGISIFWYTVLFFILEFFSVLVTKGKYKNPLENEAQLNEKDPKYIRKRHMFAWVKYFKNPKSEE